MTIFVFGGNSVLGWAVITPWVYHLKKYYSLCPPTVSQSRINRPVHQVLDAFRDCGALVSLKLDNTGVTGARSGRIIFSIVSRNSELS